MGEMREAAENAQKLSQYIKKLHSSPPVRGCAGGGLRILHFVKAIRESSFGCCRGIRPSIPPYDILPTPETQTPTRSCTFPSHSLKQ